MSRSDQAPDRVRPAQDRAGGADRAGNWADRAIRTAAGLAVFALALIAGAVSYSHMRILALTHGETGWRSHAFPLSVDGIEIVASLVLLADQRTGQRSGRLVWLSLAAGITASVTANVAVGATDPIGRIVAGWPALALLISVKLLEGLAAHPTEPPRPPHGPGTVRPQRRNRPRIADRSAAGHVAPTGAVRPQQTTDRTTNRSADRPRTVTADEITDLLPAARAVRASVTAQGGRCTRTVLAQQLRQQGLTVSNARLTLLLRALDDQPAASGTDRHEDVR
jgi:hypothetical protein